MDSQELQYERLIVALQAVRERIPTILAEARAAHAASIAIRAESARIRAALELPAGPVSTTT